MSTPFPPFAKLSPSFSFSWAELVFILNFALLPPTTHPEKISNGSNSARLSKAKLIYLLSRLNIIKLFSLEFNLKNQLKNYNFQPRLQLPSQSPSSG